LGYGTQSDYRLYSTFPRDLTDKLESLAPGFVQKRLDYHSAMIDAQLAKRYACPFIPDPITGDYPIILPYWVYGLAAADCWLKIGRTSTDEDVAQTLDAAKTIREQLASAADAEKGLFDLPLRAGSGASGIVRPSAISYSVSSPFLDQRRQRDRGRQEEQQGIGTYFGRRQP
jgi:hypothetical protein